MGQRLGRWALGPCLKPHGGEEARHRASLCSSQPTVGALPRLNSTVWKSPQHDIKNTPNCQRAQPTQRSEAICSSIFGAVCLPARKGLVFLGVFFVFLIWSIAWTSQSERAGCCLHGSLLMRSGSHLDIENKCHEIFTVSIISALLKT